jgi:pimeloyl-ACP methyl ester carboxylesterase
MKLFFRKFGEGTPLVILHGLFGTADNWNTLAKKYGEWFTTYAVDLRNHGQSPHSDEWSYELMAQDVINLLKEENIDSCYLMGHSMGGKVAMLVAGMIPDKIEKLIVCDIAPKYYAPHHTEVLEALNGLDLVNTKTRKDAEAYMESRIKDFGTRQFLLKSLYWKDEKLAWRFNLTAITHQIEKVGDALEQAGGNKINFEGPTLFIRGSKSRYILDEDIDHILEHFPNSRLTTIDGAGHWVHAEKPMEYLEVTKEFLLG